MAMAREQLFYDRRLPGIEARRSLGNSHSFKTHIHQGLSIGAVESGQVEVSLGTTRMRLSPGELILINPGIVHACNPLDCPSRSFSILYLGLDLCLAMQQTLWKTEAFLPLSPPRLTDPELFADYLNSLAMLFAVDRDLLEKEEAVARLLTTIFCRGATDTPLPTPPALGDHQTAALQDRLSANLEEELSLSELARQHGDNPFTLLRRFKEATGITPHAFRLNRRIDRAKELLQAGVEIAEVALRCGFYDQSHLHRHFKALTAMTPRQYQVNFVQ